MLADETAALMQGLVYVCAFALVAAMMCAFPLIWADLKRDLDARVREDSAPPTPRLYDQEIEDLDEAIG